MSTRSDRRIYFCGSIRGGRQDKLLYAEIIAKLAATYGVVLTEHVGLESLMSTGENAMTEQAIHDRDMAWLTESDFIVAECTAPSLGVGYEIAGALALNKPCLILYRPAPERSLSAMIRGAPGVQVCDYSSVDELDAVFAQFFGK